jgi:general secretion pathway protein F/type IV pilus assembly protein PilC
MIFKYKALNRNGKKVNGKIQALSLDLAKANLKSKSLFIVDIKESKEIKLFVREIDASELSNICRNLSLYLKAGISITYALNLIKANYDKKLFNFLETISGLIDEGNSFYSALKEQKIFSLPAFLIESIKVAEDNGILPEVLMDLSHFLRDKERVKKEVVSAMTYPMFIVIVAITMLFFMVTYLVPQITSVYTQTNQDLPKLTEIVINFSDFLKSNSNLILFSLIAFISSFVFGLKHSIKFKTKIDFFLLKLPFFGNLILKDELAKFSHILSLLSKNGVNFTKAINLSLNTLNNLVIKSYFQNANKKIVEGEKLSKSLSSYKLPKNFIQAIILAEETSQVKEVLSSLSENYFEDNRDKISRFLTLIEPSLMLIIGGFVGVIISAMILPMFSMDIGL